MGRRLGGGRVVAVDVIILLTLPVVFNVSLFTSRGAPYKIKWINLTWGSFRGKMKLLWGFLSITTKSPTPWCWDKLTITSMSGILKSHVYTLQNFPRVSYEPRIPQLDKGTQWVQWKQSNRGDMRKIHETRKLFEASGPGDTCTKKKKRFLDMA